MRLARLTVIATGLFFCTCGLAESGPLQGACMNDIKTLCGSIQPGGGRIRECMKEHRAQLSDACKIAIADRMLERAGPGQTCFWAISCETVRNALACVSRRLSLAKRRQR
jgi:hypothetical protein